MTGAVQGVAIYSTLTVMLSFLCVFVQVITRYIFKKRKKIRSLDASSGVCKPFHCWPTSGF